ncbi:glutathione S-transferase family protein [Microbaculum marinum]|uniref:glutathione transferase n=1 Tax=Microbaculum marinum TaxID=1764581 RepID=A0AAW9RZQ9_9HYPH
MADSDLTVYGAPYSVYVRIVRMTLEEKGVAYVLDPVDIFTQNDETRAYRKLNPFAKIPTLAHGDFVLYETRAIARYVDESFDGPSLQPSSPGSRARMEQVVGIVDSFAYAALVWDIYVAHTARQKSNSEEHAERIASALPMARICLGEFDRLLAGKQFFGGATVSLADLHVAPVFGYFTTVPESEGLMSAHPGLSQWWSTMSERDSWRTVSAGTRDPQ